MNLPHPLQKIFVLSFACILTVFLTVAPPKKAFAAGSSATVWTVLVGGEAEISKQEHGPAGAWQFMRFYPDTITINVGDTIVWKLKSTEPHTVTFPKPGEKVPDLVIPEGGDSKRMIFNPLAVFPQGTTSFDGTTLSGSGQLGGEKELPKEYKLTFTKEGVYEYFCAFHSMMKAKVIVQNKALVYTKTQSQIDTEAIAQLNKDTANAKSKEPEFQKIVIHTRANGTTVYRVRMGYGDGKSSWMRFAPENITIHQGDTIEWIQNDQETPHTITFTSSEKEPEMVLPEKQKQGPPKLVLNPKILQPAGSTTYSGKGYFNSGLIWGTKVPIPGSRTYSLSFDREGKYKYICMLHDEMGMKGQVKVLPKNSVWGFGISKKMLAVITALLIVGVLLYLRQTRKAS